MKNLYKQTMEEIKLDDAAKERIYNGVVNKLKEEKTEKKRTPFSLKAFRLATACASAALVCGAAIGTGVYFGMKDNENNTNLIVDVPHCYYIGYELDKDEYDIDNFEINLFYAFDEVAVRERYNEVLREAEEKGYGEVLKYEILLVAFNNNYNKYGDIDSVVLDSMEIDDIDKFPFDDYRINIVEDNGEIIERTYTHSEKVILPKELFAERKDDELSFVYIHLSERIEYEIGYTDFVPKYNEDGSFHQYYWSEDGKIANFRGLSAYRFYPKDNCLAMFYYELSANKVIIDNDPIARYMADGKLNISPITDHIRFNMKPISNLF